MSEPLKISVHVEEKRYQPTQEKTVVPDWEPVEVTPDKGYALSKVTVEGMPEPTESETFTENGTYDVGRIGTAVVDVNIDLQNKTVTPTEQTQTVEADDGYDGLDRVTVNPIPSEYVIPTGTVDITVNGQVSVAGKATANVNVPQGVFPSGTKLITENVTGEDVTNYAAVDVAVPGPSGTKQISITANGTTTEDVGDYADAEITVNTDPAKGFVVGDFDANGYVHSLRLVGEWPEIPGGYLQGLRTLTSFSNGSIDTFIVPDGCKKIDYYAFASNNFKHIVLPESLETLIYDAFDYSYELLDITFPSKVTELPKRVVAAAPKLKTVTCLGKITSIGHQACAPYNSVELFDFSHCDVIPALYASNALTYKPGCIIRIPAALSDTTLGTGNGWESATNWSALTNIVWEVV